uniref:Uncharacterized protein n=1 Tax=Rhizophora mucronata TaxID=61149 RepID=A0A2P2NEI4_RHIMU
MWWLHCKTIE